MSVNKVILVGNLGADPEIKSFESGAQNAKISLATSERFKDKNGEVKTETQWHYVIFWNKLAEIVDRYLKKGSRIYVEGKIKTRSYEDGEGVTRYVTEIIASQMTMLGGNESTSDSHESSKVEKEARKQEPENQEEDDLPF